MAAEHLDNLSGLTNFDGSVLTRAASVVDAAAPMLEALNNIPLCNADPACSSGRTKFEPLIQARNSGALAAQPAVQSPQAAMQALSTLLATAGNSVRTASIDTAAVPQQIARLQESVDARDAAQASMAGMYIPPQVLNSDDFEKAAKMFISPDGHSVRYLVETKFDPFSTAAMNQVAPILDTARGAQPNSSLSDASISMVGTMPTYSAMRSYYDDDVRLIVIVTLLVVFLILVVLLRAIVAPMYLIASVIISFLSALGLGVVFFQLVLGQPISWNVQATAFIVLVAVGADYNLLLIKRIREESGSGICSGIIRAVRSTGSVITSAGIIFAASMFGLLFGSLSTMVQTGFVIGTGLLIDTFVVRTVMVPALAVLVGRANWWPSRRANSARPVATQPAESPIRHQSHRWTNSLTRSKRPGPPRVPSALRPGRHAGGATAARASHQKPRTSEGTINKLFQWKRATQW